MDITVVFASELCAAATALYIWCELGTARLNEGSQNMRLDMQSFEEIVNAPMALCVERLTNTSVNSMLSA
jgi:hypothetical protein